VVERDESEELSATKKVMTTSESRDAMFKDQAREFAWGER
jgi:hypothetical protein